MGCYLIKYPRARGGSGSDGTEDSGKYVLYTFLKTPTANTLYSIYKTGKADPTPLFDSQLPGLQKDLVCELPTEYMEPLT